MENNSPFDSFELQFSPVAQSFFRETAKWAKFISIVGFIFIGLYVLIALMMIAAGSTIGAMSGNPMMGAMGGTTLGIIYLVGALLYFFPIRYLYLFSSKALTALESKSTDYLTDSLENLKSHYKFMGILMIVVIGLMILGFVFGIVGAFATAM
jgi:uncharacterized membrane protein